MLPISEVTCLLKGDGPKVASCLNTLRNCPLGYQLFVIKLFACWQISLGKALMVGAKEMQNYLTFTPK